MNLPKTPSLVTQAQGAGLDLVRTEQEITDTIDEQTLGIACVDLIGRLEQCFTRARALPQSEYIDEAGTNARKLIDLLRKFACQHLRAELSNQAFDEIGKASTVALTYDEVLKTRPLGNALLRAFWKADEVDSIKDAHSKLGNALIRATSATLFHATALLQSDSDLATEIDHSAGLFVSEICNNW